MPWFAYMYGPPTAFPPMLFQDTPSRVAWAESEPGAVPRGLSFVNADLWNNF